MNQEAYDLTKKCLELMASKATILHMNIPLTTDSALKSFDLVHVRTIERLGYPVSDNGNGIGDDDVTIECVDVIVFLIARLCGFLNTRDKLAVSCKYRTP